MKPAYSHTGPTFRPSKPLQLTRHEASELPEPGLSTDALIVVNDRTDGDPRPRIAVSNGASWDGLATVSELRSLMAEVRNIALTLQGLSSPTAIDPTTIRSLVQSSMADVLKPIDNQMQQPSTATIEAKVSSLQSQIDALLDALGHAAKV